MAWIGAVVSAASAYMSAKEQKKQAEEAAKGRSESTTKTPYMNEYLSAIAPWIMAEQQRIYSDRLQKYGASSSTSFNPIQSLLANITHGYSGVGGSGATSTVGGYNENYGDDGGQYMSNGYSPNYDANSISTNPFSPNYGVDPLSPEARQQFMINRANMGTGQGRPMQGRMGMMAGRGEY